MRAELADSDIRMSQANPSFVAGEGGSELMARMVMSFFNQITKFLSIKSLLV
jgi:hypothetical protein